MALKRLYTGEMVSLSASLTSAAHADRQTLAAIPAVAALLPELDGAHSTLLATQIKPAGETRLAAIGKAQKVLDVRHDNVIRGVHGLLISLAYLTKNAELASRILLLLSVILPDGIDAVSRTYREEAGQAALLLSRLSPEDRTLLQDIKLLEGTAWDAVIEWMNIGAQLGALEDERSGIPQTSGPAPADVVSARNKWIRTVRAIRSVLELVNAGQPDVVKILDRFTAAERKADNRGASAEVEAAPAEPPAAPKVTEPAAEAATDKGKSEG